MTPEELAHCKAQHPAYWWQRRRQNTTETENTMSDILNRVIRIAGDLINTHTTTVKVTVNNYQGADIIWCELTHADMESPSAGAVATVGEKCSDKQIRTAITGLALDLGFIDGDYGLFDPRPGAYGSDDIGGGPYNPETGVRDWYRAPKPPIEVTETGTPVVKATSREWQIIRAIRDSYTAGHLTRRAAKTLEEQGIPLQKCLLDTRPHSIGHFDIAQVSHEITVGELITVLESWTQRP